MYIPTHKMNHSQYTVEVVGQEWQTPLQLCRLPALLTLTFHYRMVPWWHSLQPSWSHCVCPYRKYQMTYYNSHTNDKCYYYSKLISSLSPTWLHYPYETYYVVYWSIKIYCCVIPCTINPSTLVLVLDILSTNLMLLRITFGGFSWKNQPWGTV